jgi:hypothetical protein
MKESPKSFIGAYLLRWAVAGLVAEMHHILGILRAVIHDLPIGVDHRRIHLYALHLIESTTMRWRGLRGGLLLITAGSWSLGKFLGLGRGTTWGSTNILMMLRMMLITMSHCLQEGIPNMIEYKAWVLKNKM